MGANWADTLDEEDPKGRPFGRYLRACAAR